MCVSYTFAGTHTFFADIYTGSEWLIIIIIIIIIIVTPADSYKILKRWKNYFSQLLNVHYCR
jgi:hypothetical protein